MRRIARPHSRDLDATRRRHRFSDALATDQDRILQGDTEDRTAKHVEYCYINPVKHGFVSRVGDWPFSSFHRDVSAGLFPQDWAGEFDAVREFGEASNGA